MPNNDFYGQWATEPWPSQHIIKSSQLDNGTPDPTVSVETFCGHPGFVKIETISVKPKSGPTCENCFRAWAAAHPEHADSTTDE